ncbi:MAG: ABC transporter ATP-binding protein [Candidatus Methanofastidiosia archaeon]
MIVLKDVTKDFGNIRALDSLSFKVKRSELFGLVGPNGAGKTTAIRLMCGILHPTSGKIFIDKMDFEKHKLELKKRIGYLPEEPNLYTKPTAYQLLEYFAKLYEVPNPRDRIEELLGFVGLYERKDTKIETFSKGMRHRLALARALLHDPEILILDEPTMGLDPATSKRVRGFIKTLKGKTIVLCTHYMEEADELCDRIGFLNFGRLMRIGSPQELKRELSEGTLTEVFIRLTEGESH